MRPVRRVEKASRIQQVLDELCPRRPCRSSTATPSRCSSPCVLSAQCTDERVNKTTPALFARARDARGHGRAAPTAEIRALIRSCGLAPAKAKALRALSRILVREHGGRVPRSFEELEALPGVGHKTASVVMAQAFGEPAFPVDTHIHRLAARWGLSDGSSVVRTERDLKALFPRERWNALHLQIIYFGREHCPARGHDLEACPICSWAASKARKAAESRPRRPARRQPARGRSSLGA